MVEIPLEQIEGPVQICARCGNGGNIDAHFHCSSCWKNLELRCMRYEEYCNDLSEFLLVHEHDIALHIEDFSELTQMFIFVHHRTPGQG